MLKIAFLIAKKDLKLILTRSAGLSQALLLGLLLVFLFSLSLQVGEKLSPKSASTMFWLSSIFCQVLIFQMLYAVEEQNSARTGLQLLPSQVQAVWFGKFLAGMILLVLAQLIFIPAMFIFLNQSLGNDILHACIGILLADIGICACGSLLGALCSGQSGKESILGIILFPLLVPLLLAAISLSALGLADLSEIPAVVNQADILRWHGLAIAFDALFCAAALVLFPFLYDGDNS